MLNCYLRERCKTRVMKKKISPLERTLYREGAITQFKKISQNKSTGHVVRRLFGAALKTITLGEEFVW